MSKETVENLINRSDLSDAEKVGILMDRYALNPDAKREPLVQKEHPKTKTVNNKDGTFTVYQGSVMNGKFQRHGTASTYLETDKETVVKTTNYKNGKKHGDELTWSKDGGQYYTQRVHWNEGKQTTSAWYYPQESRDTVPQVKEQFANCGKGRRIHRKWFKDGRKMFECNQKWNDDDNVYDYTGQSTSWHSNSQEKWLGKYNRFGNKHGKWVRFYKTGEKKKVVNWKNGKPVGNVKVWYKSGQLKRKENQAHDGPVVKYHPNGQKKCKGKYKNNNRHGEWVWYDRKGNVKKTLPYKKGKLHGYICYTTKKKEVEGRYKKGKKVGSWEIDYLKR